AAGVGGAALNKIGGALHADSLEDNSSLANFARNLAASTASGIANAATRSLIDGSDFGDNLRAALPDVIGQTIGNAVAGKSSGNGATTGDGKSIVDEIGDGIGAIVHGVEHIGSEIIGGIEHVGGEIVHGVENIFAPPAAAATTTEPVLAGFGAS